MSDKLGMMNDELGMADGSSVSVGASVPLARGHAGRVTLPLFTFTFILHLLLSGCVYKGAKVTEGTDLAIGLNVPVSEGTLQFQVLNYLSGFRLGVDRNAILTCRYTVAETNSYLGVVQTHVTKTMDATVQPCEVSTAETNATDAAVSP